MLHTLLTKQEQIIFDILVANPIEEPIALVFFAKNKQQTKESILRQIKNWFDQLLNQPYRKFFQLTQHSVQLTCSTTQYLNLFAHLYQQNQSCQILWAITNTHSTTINDLARKLHLSPSTIKRAIRKIVTALEPYQISISFQTDPTIKGYEPTIRWLTFCLSVIFDPPFNWFCSETLYERFSEIQQLRLRCGQNLNCFLSQHTACQTPFSFQLSEKGWNHIARQLFGLIETIMPVTVLSFLSLDPRILLFLTDYQNRLLTQTPYQNNVLLIAEDTKDLNFR
ncbi:helix-turn-helix domain-containing protein [Enterococcus sp.]|uniref:helix-turn-helix domain-containing protein n=1 Tax=Enterococcus sp. TaxID=35783 RepID=UPI002FC9B789